MFLKRSNSPNAISVLLFSTVVCAYTVQTELSQYISSARFEGYTKPYFLLYLTHSSYVFLAPMHYVALKIFKIPVKPVATKVRAALADQFADKGSVAPPPLTGLFDRLDAILGFPTWPFTKLIVSLMFLVAMPALCWYMAVPLTDMTDVTAIYNSNAFWAYVLSIYIAGTEKWQMQKAVAVVFACLGVAVISYGGASAQGGTETNQGIGSRLLGNILALVGSVAFGFYEVFYQTRAALEAAALSPPEAEEELASARPLPSRRSSRRLLLPQEEEEEALTGTKLRELAGHEDLEQGEILEVPESSKQALDGDEDASTRPIYLDADGSLDLQAFLAYANFVTVNIGIATFFILWIPLPFLHWSGLEKFELPPDWRCCLAILGNLLAGCLYNGAFLIGVSLFGSVLAAVGSLSTVVSVAIVDWLLGRATLTVGSLAGSGLIVGSFAVLAHEALSRSD